MIEVKYTKHYVAFIDALGFTELVLKSVKDESARNKIGKFYDRAQESFDRFKQLATKTAIYSVAMSDTLVLAMPAAAVNGSELDSLRELCVAVGSIQWDMARHGIWLRGGIASGDCWIDRQSNKIVGPAFLRALHFEKEVAVHPRVVLDTRLIAELGFSNRNELIKAVNTFPTEVEHANWSTDCILDWSFKNDMASPTPEDYPLFVDYLSPGILEGNIDTLEAIGNNVKSAIYQDKAYQKLKWLAGYISTVIHSHSIKTGTDNERLMKISEQLIHL